MKTNLYLFRKLKILFLFPACICFIAGCSDPLDELAKENTDAIVTKAVAWICSDSYIGTYVDGVLVFGYNGTHCWPEATGGPLGPWAGGSDPYIPDGYPYSQGGNGFGSGSATSHTFQFPQLQNIYSPNSTLNILDKERLNAVLYGLENSNKLPYRNLLIKLKNKLASLRTNITFKIDPTIPATATYSRATKTIRFVNSGAMEEYVVLEELTHAVQHLCYYGESMNGDYKNYDFEARVFQDVALHIVDRDQSLYVGLQMGTYSLEFRNEYMEWIDNLASMRYFPVIAIREFDDLCERWAGGANHLPGFTPMLLRDFFGHLTPIFPEFY